VRSVEPTGQPVVRPDGFDLAATWEEVVQRVDELRSPLAVIALVDPTAVEILRWMFERQIEVGETEHDGRIRVIVKGQQVQLIVAQLAGFGGRIEVVDPLVAREQLDIYSTKPAAMR
jgi:predicted DNA-binding transcriptional regulator YafY